MDVCGCGKGEVRLNKRCQRCAGVCVCGSGKADRIGEAAGRPGFVGTTKTGEKTGVISRVERRPNSYDSGR